MERSVTERSMTERSVTEYRSDGVNGEDRVQQMSDREVELLSRFQDAEYSVVLQLIYSKESQLPNAEHNHGN